MPPGWSRLLASKDRHSTQAVGCELEGSESSSPGDPWLRTAGRRSLAFKGMGAKTTDSLVAGGGPLRALVLRPARGAVDLPAKQPNCPTSTDASAHNVRLAWFVTAPGSVNPEAMGRQ